MNESVGRLLVTGAPGWLTDAFLRDLSARALPGLTHVRALVHRDAVFVDDDARKRWGSDVEVVRGDLRDLSSLASAVRDIDTVLHSAAIMHVHRIAEYYAVNSEGTRALARAASSAGVRRFVYVSSNAAGGKSSTRNHLCEESAADKPLSHYGRSKWLGERWLFATPGSMERSVLRLCMLYGPPVPQRHVDVYRRIQTGRMPLVGHGDYARSLSHIDNVVQGVRLALTADSRADGQVFNIADADPYTTRAVVEAMARALGVRPRYLRLPAVAAKVAYGVDWMLASLDRYQQEIHLVGESDWQVGVSIAKARQVLGYAPTVAIDEGMRGAIVWCRERGLL
jgi:nucleoside-diphosphate-sugar epimerase